MSGGLVVHLWKEWGIQILVVASFMLQVILLIFAGVRRRNSSAVLRTFLWLSYLLADNVALYALGHMSLNTRSDDYRLVAFWAPLFLLHLGGQDTITAYSLEDNQLWKRHLLTLLVQVSGAGYVLYVYIGNMPTLVSATVLLFTVGVIKYGERVFALKRANIENLGTSLDIPEGDYGRIDRRGDMDAEQEVLLGAHYLFSLCRSNFVDRKPTVGAYNAATSIRQSKRYNGGMYMYELVEVELSLLYDFLYTKAPVIHTWHGCCIRVVSSLATVAAFLLFHIGNTVAYRRVDVAITYILLVGAIVLEMTSLLSAIGSTWTCAFLHARKWDGLYAAVMCLRRPARAGSNRRWLHSIGQHNVLDFCVRDKTKLRDRVAKATGLGNWWKKLHYTSTIPVTPELKGLLMTQIVKTMVDWRKWQIRHVRGRAVLTDYGIFDDIGWSVEGKDLDECILVWHIATDIYLCSSSQSEGDPLVKQIKVLSNYMSFLLLKRPNLLPGGVRRSLFRDNCPDMEDMWRKICTVVSTSCSNKDTEDESVEIIGEVVDGTGSGQSGGEEQEDRNVPSVCSGNVPSVCSGNVPSAEDRSKQSAGEGEARNNQSAGEDEARSKQSAGDEKDGNLPVLPSSEALAKFLLQSHSDGSITNAYSRAPHLASKLLLNEWNLPNMLEIIFAVWVEFLCYAAHHCTDISHCRQLGNGGDFLTIVHLVVGHIELFAINRPDLTNPV